MLNTQSPSRAEIGIRPVSGKAGRAAFVDLGRAFAARLPEFERLPL